MEQVNHMTDHLNHSCEFLHAVQNTQFSYLFPEILLGNHLVRTLKTFVSDRTFDAAEDLKSFKTGAFPRVLVSSGFDILNAGKNVPAL